MNPTDLTVYKSPFLKRRIGKNNDGGYIIAQIPFVTYSLLLAGGIQDDISFEEDFIKTYNNSRCIAFDGTIEALPNTNDSIVFVKKNIGFENSDKVTNLHDIIAANNNIFVKMDIEGGEIPWLQSLRPEHMNKFEQIVMEFHKPFSVKETNIFKFINKTHFLIHLHGNNCCGTRLYNGANVPNIFECTYVHKRHFNYVPGLNTNGLPSNIDMRNLPQKPEINLNYPPFVVENKLQKKMRRPKLRFRLKNR